MRIIFVRHAEPDYARDSLTEKGWREAKLLAERVSQWKVDDFYCSPLGRARDTAAPSLEKVGKEAEIVTWLQEFPAAVTDPVTGNKRIPWDLMPEYWSKIPEMHDIEKFTDTELMRSGPVKEEYEKVGHGLDGILAQYGYERDGNLYRVKEHNDGTIVLFCHMGVILVMLSHLLHISPVNLLHGFFLAPSSVTVVTTEEREEGTAWFRCQTVGDTTHLHDGNEPVSHMGYFASVFQD